MKLIGFVVGKTQDNRVKIEAGAEGVRRTPQKAGLVAFGNTRVWTDLEPAALITTDPEAFADVLRMRRHAGYVQAMLDAWVEVLAARAEEAQIRAKGEPA